MKQLSLFGNDLEEKPLDDPTASQLELFNQRALGLGQTDEFLRCGDLKSAHTCLDVLRGKLPRDPVIAEQARLVANLHHRHDALLLLSPKDRAAAMLKLAREFLPATGSIHEFSRLLVSRAAREWCDVHGDDKRLDGRLPGEWFFSVGALDDAVHSFERAAQRGYDACLAFRWGDALTELGKTNQARYRYRDALLLDPFHEALQTVGDHLVRSLPDIARYEMGIEEEPRAWAAPVGIVIGVLPRPTEWQIEFGHAELPHTTTQREAVQRARNFTDLLMKIAQPDLRKNADMLIEIRRAMKKTCPELFEVVLRGRK